MIEQNILVDIEESFIETAYANQNDNNACLLKCHVENDGIDFPIPNGWTVAFYMKKANNYDFTKMIGVVDPETGEVFGSVSGNVVTIPIIDKMTRAPGRQDCRLEIRSNDGARVYTCTFYLRVRKDPTQQLRPDAPEYDTIQHEIDELSERVAVTEYKEEIYSGTQPTSQVAGGFWTQLLESGN